MSSLIDRDVVASGVRLALTAAARDAVEAHAVEGYPHEIVGILAGDRTAGRITAVHRLQNTNTDRAADRYQVSPLALMKAERALEAQGLDIVGYYHSHPDHPAMYSDTDRDLALPHMAYLIVSVRSQHGPAAVDGLRCWRLRDDRSCMDEDQLLLP